MRKKQTSHRAIAAVCRANPGEWQHVGEYNSSHAAAQMARVIYKAYVSPNSARRSAYAPAGAFEATSALTEFGARVEARYVGETTPVTTGVEGGGQA